jgi:hypothetical protein
MLHDARMAGLAKLRRSIRSTDERQQWAVHVGRGEIVWQDNGSKEPEAAGLKSRPSLMQQTDNPGQAKKYVAAQPQKRPFVVSASSVGEPMTELWTKRSLDEM